jgi:hypothetical protein
MARPCSCGPALGRDGHWVVDCQGTNAGSLTRMLPSFIAYLRSKPVISVVVHERITTGNFAKAGARGRHLCFAWTVLGWNSATTKDKAAEAVRAGFGPVAASSNADLGRWSIV